jgi:hypothetical protein
MNLDDVMEIAVTSGGVTKVWPARALPNQNQMPPHLTRLNPSRSPGMAYRNASRI